MLQAVQTLVQIQGHAVTNVIDTATGPKIVESLGQRIPTQTAVGSLIQTAPALLTLPEDKEETTPNENCDDDVYSLEDVLKVRHDFEHEQSMKLGVKASQHLARPSEILSIIEHGYQIPFTQTPPSVHLKDNRSALLHLEFVSQAKLELSQSGRAIEVSDHAYGFYPGYRQEKVNT